MIVELGFADDGPWGGFSCGEGWLFVGNFGCPVVWFRTLYPGGAGMLLGSNLKPGGGGGILFGSNLNPGGGVGILFVLNLNPAGGGGNLLKSIFPGEVWLEGGLLD